MQEAYLVIAGLVGLGYFYFWLNGYGSSPSSVANDPAVREAAGDDDVFSESSTSSRCDEPAFNIDGTPMLGFFDFHGNPYGFTSRIGPRPGLAGGPSALGNACSDDSLFSDWDNDWHSHF